MDIINITNAREKLYTLVNEVNESHKPVHIKGKNGNAVLLSSEDWEAIQETLSLYSIPGMRESIVAGMKADLDELVPEDEVEW